MHVATRVCVHNFPYICAYVCLYVSICVLVCIVDCFVSGRVCMSARLLIDLLTKSYGVSVPCEIKKRHKAYT